MARLERLRERLKDKQLDALLVTNPENRRYLTGFTGPDSGVDSAGRFIVTEREAVLITDSRYDEQARHETSGLSVVAPPNTVRFTTVVADTLKQMGVTRIGFEAEHLTVDLYDKLTAASAGDVELTWVNTTGIVATLRKVKDEDELKLIRRAQEITDAAYAYARSIAREGMTERQMAWEIEQFMRREGAEGLAFDTIVATGPHAAMAHHIPTDREIRRDEVILLDMGARVQGYHSDMTRCFVLGEPGDHLRDIHAIVRAAQERAEAEVRVGMVCADVDAIARGYIKERGYSFGHGLGHGVGLEIHEGPSFAPLQTSDHVVSGNVVTVEPGIYLEGDLGVRIEDMGMMTDHGLEIFTRSPKELLPA